MIILPENFTLGLQKVEGLPAMSLGPRTNENIDRGRVGFINRKQDRFTFSIRYYHDGITSQGKRWGKWQNLNAFSATLKNGRLNLFMIGNLMGRVKFEKVRNITRQPYLMQKAFNSVDLSIVNFLQKEFDLLYKRNGLESVFSNEQELFFSEVVKACYPAWHDLHFTNRGPFKKIPVPPLFVTDIMREPTIELAVNRMTIDAETALRKQILKASNVALTNENLWLLAVSKKRLTETQRIELLFQTEKHSQTEDSKAFERLFQKEGDKTCSILTADDLAQARNLLKTLPQEQIFSVLSSPVNSFMSKSIAEWRANKSTFKAMSFKLEAELGLSWHRVLESITSLEAKTYPIGNEEEQQAIKTLLEGLQAASNGLLKVSEPSQWRKKEKTLDSYISSRYQTRNCLPLDIVESKTEAYYPISFAYGLNAKKTTYFFILQKLGLRNNQQKEMSGDPVCLSTSDYFKFLTELARVAKADLTKYHVEATPENVSLYISSLQVLISSDTLTRFHGVLPPKWFNLTRKGLSPFAALFFLEKRTAVKDAINFIDVPESWILQAFGAGENDKEPNFFD